MSRNASSHANSPSKLPAKLKIVITGGKKKPVAKAATKKVDRRVRATRDGLGDALIALMQEQPFESITVQHVLDRAKVSRSTFYTHYSDKDDLFLSDVEDFFEMLANALTRHGDTSNRVAPVREFFEHVADMGPFMSSVNASQKARDVMELGRGHFARAIDERLATMSAARHLSATRRSALSHASAGSLFALLDWWLIHKDQSTAAQMDALFHQTLWSSINTSAPSPAPPQQKFAPRKPSETHRKPL